MRQKKSLECQIISRKEKKCSRADGTHEVKNLIIVNKKQTIIIRKHDPQRSFKFFKRQPQLQISLNEYLITSKQNS